MTHTNTLSLYIPGKPVAQGSTRAFLTKAGIPIVTGKNPSGIAAFRLDVIEAARRFRGDDAHLQPNEWQPWFVKGTPIFVALHFAFVRPKSHYGTGRNAHVLKANAPSKHISRPDGDKLTRAAFDALTIARVIHDDAAICDHTVSKTYSDISYTSIRVSPAEGDQS